jgi:hypothetical protein
LQASNSPTVQGGGKAARLKATFRVGFYRRLLDDVHFAEPDSLCNRITYASFAMQNLIELGTINAVALRKGDLTSLAFDCGLQQMNNVIIVKYKRAPAQTARGRNDT